MPTCTHTAAQWYVVDARNAQTGAHTHTYAYTQTLYGVQKRAAMLLPKSFSFTAAKGSCEREIKKNRQAVTHTDPFLSAWRELGSLRAVWNNICFSWFPPSAVGSVLWNHSFKCEWQQQWSFFFFFLPTHSLPAPTVFRSGGGSPQTEFIAARAQRTSATSEHLSDELTPPHQFLPAVAPIRRLQRVSALKGLQSVLSPCFLFWPEASRSVMSLTLGGASLSAHGSTVYSLEQMLEYFRLHSPVYYNYLTLQLFNESNGRIIY